MEGMRVEKMTDANRNYLAVVLMILCSVSFTMLSVFSVQASESFPSFQLFFLRQCQGLLLSWAYLKYYQIPLLGPPSAIKLQILNGLIVSLGAFLYLYTVARLPLFDAVALYYTGPLFVTLFSAIFLGDKLTVENAVTSVLCMSGMILISRPTFIFGDPDDDDDESQGDEEEEEYKNRGFNVALALIGALIQGPNFVLVRKMAVSVDAFVFVFYFCMVSVPVFLVCSLVIEPDSWRGEDDHAVFDIAALFGMGLSGFLGQVLLNLSLKTAAAGFTSEVSNIRYVDLLLSLIASLIIGDSVEVLSIIGALLISLTTIFWLVKVAYLKFSKMAASRRHDDDDENDPLHNDDSEKLLPPKEEIDRHSQQHIAINDSHLDSSVSVKK